MKLSYQGIQDKQAFAAANITLPAFDWKAMAAKTEEKPVWVHFGAGNIFRGFIAALQQKLRELIAYGKAELSNLNSVDIITFHDGFSYFAQYYGLHILSAVEEESGAEASAAELKEMITMVNEHQLPAIFVEKNGSDSAASIIAAETDAAVFTLDMAMSGSWFDAMYHNIDTLREALQ